MFFIWRFVLPVNQPPQVSKSAVADEPPKSVLASETITLLEEVGGQDLTLTGSTYSSMAHGAFSSVAVSSGLTVRSSAASSAVAGGASCYWAGIFASNEERAIILARLKKLKVSVAAVDVPVSGGLRYWVYLPPQATRENALAIVQSLKAAAVDSYIISEGEHRLGVSLGLFSQRALADQKIKELQDRGLSPVMDTYERAANERWLSVNKGDIDAVGDNVLSIMLKNKADVKISEKKCN